MNRDERWEKVEARVGQPQGYIYEEPGSKIDATQLTEFLIEVRTDKTVWYCRIIVENQDMELYPNTFQFTLDKMVEQIDNYMENTVMAFYEERR